MVLFCWKRRTYHPVPCSEFQIRTSGSVTLKDDGVVWSHVPWGHRPAQSQAVSTHKVFSAYAVFWTVCFYRFCFVLFLFFFFFCPFFFSFLSFLFQRCGLLLYGECCPGSWSIYAYTGVIRTLEYLRNALCCIHKYTEYAILTLDIDTLPTYSCQFQHLLQGNKTTRVTAWLQFQRYNPVCFSSQTRYGGLHGIYA